MFRALLLIAIGLGAVLAQSRDVMPKCVHIKNTLRCCKSQGPKSAPQSPVDIKECLAIPSKFPPTCESAKCIAEKRGFGKADGSIDKEAFQKFIETNLLKDDPDLCSNIISSCVNEDISKYGPEDMCELMKLSYCMDIELVKNCDDWNNDGDCKGVQDLAEECIKDLL